MLLLVFLFLVFCSDLISCQTVRSASLLQYRAYMIDVVSETMQGVEKIEWCNLKIPEITQDANYTFFGRKIQGHVSYKNGYVVTIQHLDIVQQSVQQVWNWNNIQRRGQVDVRAQLRLHDVVLGFDVIALLDDREHRYTSTFTHRLLSFNFSILRNMLLNTTTVTVTGVNPLTAARMSYSPNDKYSEAIGTKFTVAVTAPAVVSWGPEVFTPIAYDVVMNKIDFPTVCFNC